jgi:hypothetical protein
MLNFAQALHQYYVIPLLVVLFISWLFWLFFTKYWKPANKLNQQLIATIQHMKQLPSTESSLFRSELDQHFSLMPFKHAWQMYRGTLHQSVNADSGEETIIGYRATSSSEYFFSQSLVVDTPLRVEFFKHIPSIMTGIGIIGTFFGLLLGLSQFDPAGDPANIQNSLGLLLEGVRDAFLASFFAISAAMFVTWKEKSWLRTCYATLEELTTAIDGLFDSAELGEEYLEKLVQSAQDSATQTKQLKDSLVSDLKAMMENLTLAHKESHQDLAYQLIESSVKNSSDMATKIGQSITDGLQAPLEKIVNSVQQINGNQSSAVENLLTDVLSTFTSRLEATFGNQMTGTADMMSQSVSAMREMQLGFNQLISDLRNNSEASSKALEQQMLNMLTEIQQKQGDMGNQMSNMLQQVQHSVAQIGDTGVEASRKMNQQVTDLLNQTTENMAYLMDNIAEKKEAQDRFSIENQNNLQQKSTEVLDQITTHISDMLNQTNNNMNRLMTGINEKTIEQERHVLGNQQALQQTSTEMLDQLTQQITNMLSQTNSGMENMMADISTKRDAQDRIALENQQALQKTSTGMLEQLTQQISEMLSQTNNSTVNLMNDIAEKRKIQDQIVLENQKALQQETTKLLNQLTEQVSHLIVDSQTAIQSTRENIEKISQVSISSITGMNNGAEKMHLAADRFSTAGISLSTVTEGCSSLLTQVDTVSTQMSSTTNQLRSLVTDYQQSRDSVDQAIQVLEKLILQTEEQSGMSSQMLSDMQKMTQALQNVQNEMQQYLSQVNDVLVQSFDSFGAAVENSLTRSLGSFDNTLDQAVSRLASGIESLNDVAEELADMAQRNAHRS